jgi:HSP20 family protein
MLMGSDPFREFDRFVEQVLGGRLRPAVMPMDAYREGDTFVARFDLPGVDPGSLDVTVERNVLTVSAHRGWQPADEQQVFASERLHGEFSRQLFLGDGLDTEHVQATYADGVLTVTIPVTEEARPRKVAISAGHGVQPIEAAASAA